MMCGFELESEGQVREGLPVKIIFEIHFLGVYATKLLS